MAFSVPTLDERGDAELISAVRAGDVGAYGELFSRHVAAARRLARQLVPAGDVDDLVSEAFAKVLGVLQRGGGPDLAFRAYLLTAVRRLHVDRIRANARVQSADDLTPFDPGVPFRDTAVEGFENAAAARAFASLPERWQLVLWHTEVEGHRPADVAPLLAMSPNAVSALAYRAREGLRQAYLSMHAADVDDDACERTRAELGGYVRGGLSRRDAARVEQHLQRCRPCTALYLELTEVNSGLRALLAPMLLGSAATAYVAAGHAPVGVGLALLLGRARDVVLSHGPTAAVAGAAASAVVAGTVITIQQQGPPPGSPAGDAPAAAVTPSSTPDRVVGQRPVARQRALDPDPTMAAAQPSDTTTIAPVVPGADPATAPPASPDPPPDPTPEPTAGPTPSDPAPSGPAPSSPAEPAPSGPTEAPSGPPPPIDLTAEVALGPTGLEVGLGLGVVGVPILPETRVGVPLPGSG